MSNLFDGYQQVMDAAARALEPDGLCHVEGRTFRVPPDMARLVRVVAACFDNQSVIAPKRHSAAI